MTAEGHFQTLSWCLTFDYLLNLNKGNLLYNALLIYHDFYHDHIILTNIFESIASHVFYFFA